MTENAGTGGIPPVERAVTVELPVEEAFRRFTEEMGAWWPMETHTVAGSEAETVVFEGREGGRVYERAVDGSVHEWGTVRNWEPPSRFVMTWHPGRSEDTAQELEVRFTRAGSGTRVEVRHGGWEALGGDAAATRDDYDGGWEFVLGRFTAAVRKPI